jgi:hypothetical protein
MLTNKVGAVIKVPANPLMDIVVCSGYGLPVMDESPMAQRLYSLSKCQAE